MVSLMSLGIPILLSAVLVFVVSSIIHMVLPYHRNDFRRLQAEDDVMSVLRPLNIPPGEYMVPRAATAKDMKAPEFVEKLKKGPVLLMTVIPSGPISMGKSLLLWFLYSVFVSVIAAYVTSRAVDPGAGYRAVFRFAGCTAFTGYSVALLQDSIWHKRKWSTTLKMMFDGLIYGFLTAGTFGWLWPR